MMKLLVLAACAVSCSMTVSAQGNSGNKGKSKNEPAVSQPGNSGDHGKDKIKNKDKSDKADNKEQNDKLKNDEHDRKIWDGIWNDDCAKSSKNQPAKVRAAFQRDYPNALNVRWTKCRGDWTATFNGILFRSTAVYQANGDRRDTRTPVLREQIPRRIIDIILNKRPGQPLDEAIRIEVPRVVKDIFRIKAIIDGKTSFEYYDSDGVQVNYNY